MKGFTLVELLVVMAIIVVISTIALVNYRVGEKSFSLDESAVLLAQNLRRAQEMALSSKEFQGSVPRGGYGVYLQTDNDFYIIFADCDNNQQYSLGNACNGFPETVEQVVLSKRGKISSLFSGSYLSAINIVFIPPNPTIVISGSGSEAVIKLCLKDDSSMTRTIRVNKAGLIESF